MLTERAAWLDVFKGVGIILVVLGHVSEDKALIGWIYSFHMPLFFFASGYVYKQKEIFADIKKRLKTVIIPYFVFGTLELVYWLLIERRFRASGITVSEAIVGLLRGEADSLDFNRHLWFLPCFFVTSVLFNIFISRLKRPYLPVILLSAVYVLAWAEIPSMIWGIDKVCRYIFFFALGFYVSRAGVIENLKGKSLYGAGILAVSMASVYLIGSEGATWFLNAVIGIAGLTMICLPLRNRVLEYLGQITLVILCVHGPVYRVIIEVTALLTRTGASTVRHNLLLVLIITSVTLAVCAAVNCFVARYMPWAVGKGRIAKNADSHN